MNTDYIQIINDAAKAPSGHNTQPWKFHIAANMITVIPDIKAALPVVDKNNRELFISLGCAIENLCISASHFGYSTRMLKCNSEGITIQLTEMPFTIEDMLFQQIEKRQTNRSLYQGKKIPDDILKKLQSLPKEPAIQCYFTETGSPFANTLTEYIIKGNEIQLNDAAFRNELISWMRFNGKQVEATKNGLSYQVFGSPPLPAFLGRHIVKFFLNAKTQNKSDSKKIASSSHFIVYTTQHNTIEEWVSLGRTLQRCLLKATETGISYAFMNQPCEVTTLARALQKILPVNEEYPALILRIGYANPVACSPRKKITI